LAFLFARHPFKCSQGEGRKRIAILRGVSLVTNVIGIGGKGRGEVFVRQFAGRLPRGAAFSPFAPSVAERCHCHHQTRDFRRGVVALGKPSSSEWPGKSDNDLRAEGP
jgi:hypothetical protein